jgi:hypothetical protein
MSSGVLAHHQAALSLAGLTLEVKPAALARLEARERALGFHLPAAVREWYALDPPSNLMGLGDNQDWPYGIADLEKVEGGYLVIMRENQSVVLWAVHLDGTDDPPIAVLDERPSGLWHHHADHFSSFVYARIWDYQTMSHEEGCRVEGGSARVDSDALTWLGQRYHEGPRTLYWPCETTYRFSHSDTGARILTGNSALYGPQNASYNYFWAKEAGGLEAALRDVSRFGGMVEDLWSNDEDECGLLVLERLRK